MDSEALSGTNSQNLLRKASRTSSNLSRTGSNLSDGVVTRRKFHSWSSFQNSYELVAIGEDLERRCLHNHLLHQMQAMKDCRFVCDFCRCKITQGEMFWSCPRCVWDVCEACYARGARFKSGGKVELVRSLDSRSGYFPRGTTGVIQDVVNDTEGKHLRLHLLLDGPHQSQFVTLNAEDFAKLKVLESEERNIRMVVGIVLITGLFLYGILDHHHLSVLLKRFVAWCRTLGIWAAMMLFVVSSILPVIMLPVFPIMALSGPLFTEMNDGEAVLGGSIAFLVVFGGLWVGSVLAFALGKTLLHDYARRASKQSRFLRRLNRIIDKAGIKIVFMARSLPILPAEVFDYACAMTTLAVHEYAIGCIGSAVPVAFWTFSTAQASNLAGPDRSRASHVALILLNVGCLVLLTIVLVHVIQRHEQDNEDETISIDWQEQWIDAKQEVAALLQAENLQILREGRDFTIRDKSNKLLQLWDDHGILPFLLRKEKKLELNKENFPLKVHVHKEPPLVNDLIEPAFHAVKRTSSSVTTRASGSPEHLYARVDCEPPPFP
ncbi:unnamed protein product [Durusdinium trenchii]|uniref:VTT domain-containing protein n=1 Tax=Durusdinium trenchii TaxID=1381693 RepID=A0ABP0IHG2_9DINO